MVYVFPYILLYVDSVQFQFRRCDISNVHSTWNFDWHSEQDSMVRFEYWAEFYLTCHNLWDRNPYLIGRTIQNLRWSFLINASRFIIWFQHTLIYNILRKLWENKSISHSHSHGSFWQIVRINISVIWFLQKVPSRSDFFCHSRNFSCGIARILH